MSKRDPATRSNIVRVCRTVLVPLLALNLVTGTVNAVAGNAVAFASFAVVLCLIGAMALQTHFIRRVEKLTGVRGSLPEAVLRKAARRPRRTMTPADYAELRDMELELGYEPSEAAMPGRTPALKPAARRVTGCGCLECHRSELAARRAARLS